MHHIHTTDAFVIATKNVEEANRLIWLYTRDFGMVMGHAQSIRKSASKLRYSLQQFSYVRVGLVRGRSVWRIVHAIPIQTFHALSAHPKSIRAFARILFLLKKLVHGEEENEELFATLFDTYTFLSRGRHPDAFYGAVEMIAVFRILYVLGHTFVPEELRVFISEKYSSALLEHAIEKRELFIKQINESLHISTY